MNPQDTVLLWARASRDVIALHRSYIRLTGDLGAGAALSQLLYWFDIGKNGEARVSIEHDGHLWLAKTAEDFALELGLVDPETQEPRSKVARRYLSKLEKSGFIATKILRFQGAPTLHIRPDFSAIASGLSQVSEGDRVRFPETGKWNSRNGQNGAATGDASASNSRNGKLDFPKTGNGTPESGKTINKEAETTTEITTTTTPHTPQGGQGPRSASPSSSRAKADRWSKFDSALSESLGGIRTSNARTGRPLAWVGELRAMAGNWSGDDVEQACDLWGAYTRSPGWKFRPRTRSELPSDFGSFCKETAKAAGKEREKLKRPPRPAGAPENWQRIVYHEYRPGDWRLRSEQFALSDLGLDKYASPETWPAWLREAYDVEVSHAHS